VRLRRAVGPVSADRPSSALDAADPLHSILSGFSEPADDVLADGERGGGATVDRGPSRRSSAGRPLDEPPFTPPVPTGGLRALVAEESVDAPRHSLRERMGRLVDALPWRALVSPRIGVVLIALLVAVVALSRGEKTVTPQPAPLPKSHAAQGDRDSEHRRRETGRRARHRARPPRHRSPAARASRQVSAPAPLPDVSVIAPAPLPDVSATPPPAPAPRSRFTSEFTP
jgi:hypothetical protein